jgi:single-stranded DNA-specific DHH superfamily exonuclease
MHISYDDKDVEIEDELSEIKKEALNSLEHYLSQCFAQQTLEKKVDDYIVLTLADLTFANLDKLNALKPFGSGFPSPMMMIKDVPATALNFSAKPPHYITTSLSPQASLFSFKVTKKDIQDGSSVDLIGKIKENRFKDVKKVQFVIDKVNEKS